MATTCNSYDVLKRKHQEEFNAFPMGAAFSEEQFKEMMKKWGLRPAGDRDKVLSLGYGCFIQKKDLERFREMNGRHREELKQAILADTTGLGFIKDMFYSEMANHEYGYTGDPEDTLGACGIPWKRIQENEALAAGWKAAEREIFGQDCFDGEEEG